MINVTKTYLPEKKRFLTYVDRIYKNGWVTNNGELVQELTLRLQDYLGIKNLVLVSNGTSALEVAYRLLELEGEVVTTPFSFVATTSSLVSNGLHPIYADINAKTFNIDPDNIDHVCRGSEVAIVATHVYGNPCDIDRIQSVAEKRGLKTIYDAAHCFGVKYRNRSILSYGDVSAISFHATKLFHTIEGGGIVVNNPDLLEEAQYRINFGIDGYDSVKSLGTNAKMNEFEAAMGLCVLDDIDLILEKRSQVADYYQSKLRDNVQFQEKNPLSSENNAYFPVLFESETECLAVLRELNAAQIYPRRYFYPSLDTLPYHRYQQHMPISRDVASRIMTLPIFPDLRKNEQDVIISLVNQGLKAAHGKA